ncbi:MAG TPA: hypothetical protein P5216_03955, partial [Bacteroidota bacterium]|nr:hypothetical protein [Bacteroidota bacterium]
MKKCIYFTVLCVVINISTLFADNWEPYPFHSSLIYTTDYSYSYQVGFNPLTNFTSSTKGQFFRVRFDSVSYNNDGSRTYYSERFLRHKNLPCASDSFDISARSIDAY